MTYHSLVTPYLKGLHLILASYHPGRNKFGWEVATKKWAAYLHKSVDSGKLMKDEALHMTGAVEEPPDPDWEDQPEHITSLPHERKPLPPPPKTIKPVPTLPRDVLALISLFEKKVPGNMLLRASQVCTIMCVFAAASGSGCGSTVMLKGGIRYQIETWGLEEDETSNF
jgi:hypothetical protein